MDAQSYASVASVLQSLLQAHLDVDVLKQREANLIWLVELPTLLDASRETIEATEDALLI